MPQSMSLFYMRVVLGYLQLLPWEESSKVIEQFITLQVSEFELTRVMELLDHPVVIKSIKNNTVSSPALNTCIGGT